MSATADNMPVTSARPEPILTINNSITVRPYHTSDVESIAKHANNRRIWLNMTDSFPHPYTIESSQSWVKHATDPAYYLPIDSALASPLVTDSMSADPKIKSGLLPAHYAICCNNEPIGSVGAMLDKKELRNVALGYWLAEPFWGRGIATDVAIAFSRWIFDTFPWISRIDADAYSWNGGSQKVLKKAGFDYEGRQRLKAHKDGKVGDLVLFGMLREGWNPEIMTTNAP